MRNCMASTNHTVPDPSEIAYKLLWWLDWLFLLNVVVKIEIHKENTGIYKSIPRCCCLLWSKVLCKFMSYSGEENMIIAPIELTVIRDSQTPKLMWIPVLPHFFSLDGFELSWWYQEKTAQCAHILLLTELKYKLCRHPCETLILHTCSVCHSHCLRL